MNHCQKIQNKPAVMEYFSYIVRKFKIFKFEATSGFYFNAKLELKMLNYFPICYALFIVLIKIFQLNEVTMLLQFQNRYASPSV